MGLITLAINNREVQVEEGTTILESAKKLNVKIPTLCHVKLQDDITINHPGSCRVCMVEVEGRQRLAPACSTPVENGMKVNTNSIKAIKARRTIVELLLSDHPKDCLLCEKNMHCELQKIASELGIREIKYTGEMSSYPKDDSSCAIIRDPDKCILCRRCETICNKVQTVEVLSAVNRGFKTNIGTAFNLPMTETKCTFCGQCVSICPTGALTEVNYTSKVWNSINNDKKIVIAQIAPAVRATIGEEFGLEPGTIATGKLIAALRALGFDKVFDTNFAADLTIVEEATEFMHRLENNGRLPMLTSCCPGWINFFEHDFNELIDIPSSCKSPQQMFGAIAKTYFAAKMNLNPEDIVVVSIMPCLAKKYEAARPEMQTSGVKDVDIVISTRELAKMIKEAGINFTSLKDEDFDSPLGESTGAGTIFGASGGVMEAALRTVYEWMTKESIPDLEFKSVRGIDGIKEASVKINDINVNVAIANGLGNARKLLNMIRNNTANYHIIEIMACPGGCIGGGGQPYIQGHTDILKKRAEALYKEDKDKAIRKSHDNPYVLKLYQEFLGEPYGKKAHRLLHTHYTKK
ncbi:2Fe-2S iron-sulfur cluster binding domain-containing protein [Clostridium bovifaecis]|uniref:2Fe-2S iron-sulfur cluster binding domain-containing protein n=1 Tax=Clostridium bovifaecis TaxID=2184719 RepID=A0A6I6F3B0_9CLOT|nr:2Fe-2S iron-sulfur cluster binding domain-containing protein [Clostridium bovifaecis]